MTLSPGAKIEPKRSTLRSPAGFKAACSSMLSERAPTPPRFIGQSTWMSWIAFRPKRPLGRERAPLTERGRASLFVVFAADEMTFLFEMVADLSINRAEFVEHLRASEPLHGSLLSSKKADASFPPDCSGDDPSRLLC